MKLLTNSTAWRLINIRFWMVGILLCLGCFFVAEYGNNVPPKFTAEALELEEEESETDVFGFSKTSVAFVVGGNPPTPEAEDTHSRVVSFLCLWFFFTELSRDTSSFPRATHFRLPSSLVRRSARPRAPPVC
ncbi:MAG: hypothetical protein EP343_28095 [Deltaproteobacteria bacterium]|nr:MAG: hypothetical protein EP343_28095 [Deltaproteobacteria bacterium]